MLTVCLCSALVSCGGDETEDVSTENSTTAGNSENVTDEGYIYTVIDGLRYGIKDNEAEIAEQPRNINGEIVIPASISYKGASYPVTSIGKYAFERCSRLTRVTFEEGNQLTSIGSYAFEYCDSLTSMEISRTVTSVGYGAFSSCSSLTIYCEAEEKPSGWSSSWNRDNYPVVWGHEQ